MKQWRALTTHDNAAVGASEDASPLGLDPFFCSFVLSPTIANLCRRPKLDICVANVDTVSIGMGIEAASEMFTWRYLVTLRKRKSVPGSIRHYLRLADSDATR